MSPISQDLLALLVCPENHQPLEIADPGLLKRLNEQIAAGQVVNQSGEAVKERVEAGLVRQDRKLLYIIEDDIPVMLLDEAISLDQLREKG